MILIGYRSLSSPKRFLVSEILPSSKLDMYLATFSDLKDLIEILKNTKDYQKTYKLFSDLFSDGETDAKKWYEEKVKLGINNL